MVTLSKVPASEFRKRCPSKKVGLARIQEANLTGASFHTHRELYDFLEFSQRRADTLAPLPTDVQAIVLDYCDDSR